MVNSVAVLSDIHGVLPALEAVLAEPDVTAADLIVLTGDIAAGPQPVEVLDVLAGLGDQVCWVGGNCERELVEARAGKPASIEVSNWAAGQLRDDQVARLAALPATATFEIDGLGPTLFCHATPRDDEEVVLVDSRMSRWAEVFAGLPAEVSTVVCGHTHKAAPHRLRRGRGVRPGGGGVHLPGRRRLGRRVPALPAQRRRRAGRLRPARRPLTRPASTR
ncbi:metallophosphoesterase family protein [Micromonospora zamorensis]|uniref:metallophosphoesterase family protein n=1 Tax=Micromonospora zamorensis TaxID=709883 RepID=UPI0037912856